MNRDLAKYMLSLKDELSMRIWLDTISKSARNGTVNIMYKDLLRDHRFTKKSELDKYFNPKDAAEHGVIKILVETDSFISINFRLGTKQEVGRSQLRIIEKENAPVIIKETNTDIITNEFNKADNYTPSTKLIRAIIVDYTTFFKLLQENKAALIGRTIEAVPPNIHARDVKHIKDLCSYFYKLPKITNEEGIQKCFHLIYNNWFNLSEFVQKGFELGQIGMNINKIIIEIKNLNHGTQDKRESETNQKIGRARQKDYSKLVRAGKEDD